MKQYVEVEQAWYNELIRTKAKWDLFIDLCIHKDYPKYNTDEVNDLVNDYYSKIGIKPEEKTVDTDYYIEEYTTRKPLKITEEGVR